MINDHNYLVHYKYLSKYKKNGKWRYIYDWGVDTPGRDNTTIRRTRKKKGYRTVKGSPRTLRENYTTVYYDAKDSTKRMSDIKKSVGDYRKKDSTKRTTVTINGMTMPATGSLTVNKKTKIVNAQTGKEMSPIQVNLTSDINKVKRATKTVSKGAKYVFNKFKKKLKDL